jgi:hypothetical protein
VVWREGLLDAVCEMKLAQAKDWKARWGLPVIFESRTCVALEATAISTQFEPSPLYVDFCQWMGCTGGFLTGPG